MTNAPGNLRAVRSLLLEHLDIPPLALGIVGDTAHQAEGDSYHLGRPEQRIGGYSGGGESSRDAAGLSVYASALDVGMFSHGPHNLRTFSRWCVEQCVAGAPDTRDIREIIYSLDGQTVKRWDRLGRRSGGDLSHTGHTHFSFFRDSTKAGRDQTPLFRRYLTTIGVLEDDMANFTDAHAATLDRLAAVLPTLVDQSGYTDGRVEAMASGRPVVRTDLKGGGSPVWVVQQLQALASAVKVEGTSPAELSAALAPVTAALSGIREDLAKVQAGDLQADAFVDAVARRLAGNAGA